MLAFAVAILLLAADPAALRVTAMGDASWQRLVPGAEKGPEVATVLGGAGLSQTLLRLAKDTALPPGVHDADATLVLLEGEMTIEAAGKTFALTPGSVLEIPKGTRYAGRTKWDKKALALLTLAGTWSRAAE
jgi:quercetin dioxygenase-like cupin family protein